MKDKVKTHLRTQRQVQAIGKTISRPEGHLGEYKNGQSNNDLGYHALHLI